MNTRSNGKQPNETLTQYLSRLWGGTKWKCGITDEEFTMPNVVTRGQFFQFGNSFIDVGDEFMCRLGGNPIKITE